MINTSAFDYISVLNKAADASWLRNEAISNNIANVDTPGYKREDVTFQSELQKAMTFSGFETTDAKVHSLATTSSSSLQPRTYKDYSGYSYRLDGNNVDIDTEQTMLAKNQLMYEGLLTSIDAEFTNLKTVMK